LTRLGLLFAYQRKYQDINVSRKNLIIAGLIGYSAVFHPFICTVTPARGSPVEELTFPISLFAIGQAPLVQTCSSTKIKVTLPYRFGYRCYHSCFGLLVI
jgi:hypothetical protein